ncbi:hypothetical protein [Saccharopolyspora taberi]|uniref:hypothetical protein n=1 Tax=Saccharopolyspora taberi TaxID=60895 RepID=UPI003CD0BA91
MTAINDRTSGLVTSAGRLAERLPMLGTAPPALHLAMRLREAAGQTGLAGEVTTADTGINGFHSALRETVTGYLERDSNTASTLRGIGGAHGIGAQDGMGVQGGMRVQDGIGGARE